MSKQLYSEFTQIKGIIQCGFLCYNGAMENNQQPRPKGTGYVVLIRYLYSGFNPFNRPEACVRKHAEGIKPLNTNKYFRLRSLTFSLFIFLFLLFLCKPVMADITDTDDLYELQEDEAPEIVVYGEATIPLDKDAFVYVFTDTKIMRPIIDIIPIRHLKSWQAAQVIDRTEIAVAALFTSDTGRFFQIAGFGSYPNYIANIALAIDKNWKFTFREKDRYWYSEKDRLSVSVSSEEVYIVGWRRSRVNPVCEESGVKTPEGFIAFRHRSGEPAPLSLWLENRNFIVERMLANEGITTNLPVERLFFNLYSLENNVYKADVMLQTKSLYPPDNLVLSIPSITVNTVKSEFENPQYGKFDSVMKTLFFSNPPVQNDLNDHNVEFQSVILSEEEISSLLKIFMKYWK